MSLTERVTISLSSDLVEEIDRLEPNRSRFIAEAVRRELARRRRQLLTLSLARPHEETVDRVGVGLADWTGDCAADDELLVDVGGGVPVRWVEGRGWLTEPA